MLNCSKGVPGLMHAVVSRVTYAAWETERRAVTARRAVDFILRIAFE